MAEDRVGVEWRSVGTGESPNTSSILNTLSVERGGPSGRAIVFGVDSGGGGESVGNGNSTGVKTGATTGKSTLGCCC